MSNASTLNNKEKLQLVDTVISQLSNSSSKQNVQNVQELLKRNTIILAGKKDFDN